MLAFLGTAGLVVALLGSVLLTARGISSARSHEPAETRVDLGGPVWLLLSGAIVAMGAMQVGLITDDFSLAYLANHHSTTTPFPFDVATSWAALEGSILLWGLVLAGFTATVLRRYRRQPDRLGAAALAVMGGVAIFFFGLMVTVANPFEVCVQAAANGCISASPWPFAAADAPLNGPGPNPLLQNNYLMAIHPPMLYLGYVGLTVPFAYAIGALAIRIPGPEWLRRSHRSTLVAWSFLTLGIVLGAWWAYDVLSWGGYWAWDPVENASLMPWLVATAFLPLGDRPATAKHASGLELRVSHQRLCVDHSRNLPHPGRGQSTQSTPLPNRPSARLCSGSWSWFWWAVSHSFRPVPIWSRAHSGSTRLCPGRGAFLLNNLLLTIYAFVVLIGTTYPLILKAFTGTQVGVGEPFFNRLAVPLTFLLLLVMGFGPVTPWGQPAPGLIWKRTRGPALVGLAGGLGTALFVTRNGWVVLAVSLGLFVVGAIFGLLVDQARRRKKGFGESLPGAAKAVISGDTPFWAGQLSHVGVVLVAIGIAFAANLGAHLETSMVPGQSVAFAGNQITYESPFQETHPNKTTRGARLVVTKDDRFIGILEPAANFFAGGTAGVSTPDKLSSPQGDLYATLLNVDSESATLTFDTSPLIWFLWLGGLVTAGGGMWAMIGRRQERIKDDERQTVHV